MIEAVRLIETEKFWDDRGFFMETYNSLRMSSFGVDVIFVQDNFSQSDEIGTLRGLHFQNPPYAQAKLVRCVGGAIFDVAVDIRIGSPSFGKWVGHELSAENGNQFYIPTGFAHGFITLEPNTQVAYKCSEYYQPKAESSLNWNDPTINIKWPLDCQPRLSVKDAAAPFLDEFDSPFVWENS